MNDAGDQQGGVSIRTEELPYADLSPDLILDAIEELGFWCDGRLLALNSYENRVYQVGIEEDQPMVAKFYRPGRWTDEAIIEEHRFSRELADADIPVVPPIERDGRTLFEFSGYRFALFPRQGGREPVLESENNIAWLGRLLGRMHLIGRNVHFEHRQRLLDLDRTRANCRFVAEFELMPDHCRDQYTALVDELLGRIEPVFSAYHWQQGAIHGDCHRGNVLWTDDGPHFVDLDDCVTGMAVHDFWMLLDGDPDEQSRQLEVLIEGYENFCLFDPAELALIEPLRVLRILDHAAWLARRWQDPAFPRSFPWFGDARYFEGHVASLHEQLERLG